MSLVFNTSTTITSAVRDGCVSEATNEAIVVTAAPDLRKFDMSTGSQNGGNITVLTSPGAVCLLTSASAFVMSTSSSTVDLVEIASGYRQNYASPGTAVVPAPLKGQQCAGDIANGIAFGCSNTTGQLVKFVASTFLPSTTSPLWLAGQKAMTIIFKGSGNFIIGTNTGNIIEFDSAPNIVKQYHINESPNSSLNSSIISPIVSGLSYDNNMLAVSTVQGFLYCFDHSTGEMLYKQKIGQSTSTTINGTALCAAASGVTLYGYQYTCGVANTIAEADFTVNAITIRDILYSDITTQMVAFGINSTNNNAFAIQEAAANRKVWFFTITPRDTTTRAFTCQYPSGTNVKADLVLFSETTNQVILDTYAASPGTYRVPTGHTIKEIRVYGEGTSAVIESNRYSV